MNTKIASLPLLVAMGALSTVGMMSSCSDDKVSSLKDGEKQEKKEELQKAEVNLEEGLIKIPGLEESKEVMITIEQEENSPKSFTKTNVPPLIVTSIQGGVKIDNTLIEFIKAHAESNKYSITFLHFYIEDKEICQKIDVVEIIGSAIIIWENDGIQGVVDWSQTYRFSNTETSSGDEIYAIPMDKWAIIKESTFYLLFDGADGSNVCITTGWWESVYYGGTKNCIALAKDDYETGKKVIEINIKKDGNLYELIDEHHLLFTGENYTPLKLYYYK